VTTFATQFLTDLKGLATTTVTVATRTSVNNYGEPSFSGGTSYNAYVQKQSKTLRNLSGDEVLVEYVAYVPSATYAPSVNDRVTTADGITRLVVETEVRSDEFGPQVVVLYLGQPRP